MTHRGKRSIRSRQKRLVRTIIFNSGFHDSEQKEIVNRLSITDLLYLIEETLGYVDFSSVPDIIEGEVLVDSRGRGSFQKV